MVRGPCCPIRCGSGSFAGCGVVYQVMDLKPGQSPTDICIFCMGARSSVGPTCTYGLGHEYPEPPVKTGTKPKGVDPKLCSKCGLHPKNPKFASSDCGHEFPSV